MISNTHKNFQNEALFRLNLSNLSFLQDQTSALIPLPDIEKGRYGFHFSFDFKDYPLDRRLCYMQHKDGIPLDDLADLRFSEMKFTKNPPGIKVGPWPGWRGIPEMPKITIEIGELTFKGRHNFWGDEFETGMVRAFVLASIPDLKISEMKLSWSDIRLSPISLSIYRSNKIRPQPIPVQLRRELYNTHPRLLLSASDLQSLRKKKSQSCQKIWDEIEALLNNWEIPFEITPESKLLPGAERLHEYDRAVIAAFHALITENAASIHRAKQAFVFLLDLSLNPNYEPMIIDTQSGECLFTLCLTYDWLFQFLSNDERDDFQKKLFVVAERVWQHLGYDREDYGQAHFLGSSHGLLAFSYLFWEQHPRAYEWASYLRGVFEYILTMLPEDGYYPHGINLWIYEHAFLLRYLELFRHCADLNYWDHSSYWKNASLFRAASLSPDRKNGVTFGDPQYRVAGDAWMHYLIANRTNSPEAQELGNQLSNVPVEDVDFRNAPARRRVWEFLYFNPFKGSKSALVDHSNKLICRGRPLKGYSEIFNFEDGGQIFWRNKIQSKDILITFRSGYPLGKQRYYWGEWGGYGHSDPCNGSFLIAKGDSFWFCGPGPVYRRDTALHNTLTFDNHGQIGNGMVWAPEFIPEDRFPSFQLEKNRNYSSIITDLTTCYLDFIGVKKAVRRFMVFPGGVILIHDAIQLISSREIQWNVHTYGNIEQEMSNNALQFKISDKSKHAKIIVLLPENIESRTGLSTFVPAYPNSGERDRYLQLFKQTTECEFLILIILENIQFKYDLDFPDKNSKLWKLNLTIEREDFSIANYS